MPSPPPTCSRPASIRPPSRPPPSGCSPTAAPSPSTSPAPTRRRGHPPTRCCSSGTAIPAPTRPGPGTGTSPAAAATGPACTRTPPSTGSPGAGRRACATSRPPPPRSHPPLHAAGVGAPGTGPPLLLRRLRRCRPAGLHPRRRLLLGPLQHQHDHARLAHVHPPHPPPDPHRRLPVPPRAAQQRIRPRHRVTLEVEVTEDGTTGFRPVDEADWSGYAFQTLTAALPQHLIPATRDEVRIRVVSHNEFLSVPNRVLLDWIAASYVRSLVLEPAAPLRLEVPDAGRTTLQVQAPAGRRLTLLDPAGATGQTVIPTAGGTARLTLDLPEARTLWLFDPAAVRAPVRLARATGPDWSDPALSADYVIITTPLLRPSAEQLAAYRREQNGYEVRVIDQQDLFDQFDYGRPTPIAIRRFVRATRGWARAPRYLTLWGDLLRPEDGRPRRPLGPWEVISFGYAPADGWFAMQLTDEADWSEGLAVGRIPLRSNDDGQLFLDKLTRYENAPPGDWQKRAIQLAGGFTAAEQQLLQNYTLSWGAVLARAPMGADTLTFFKNVTEPLDPSFQDSLRLALRSGAGWLTYFGHSAADSWEIVTDDPEDFDNADRLPVVLSLGCNTGNVAGGQFETTDRLVLGERLVIGSANGAIAHWGSSSPSTITLPGILAQEVHTVVFRDTVRVLGVAFQEAKRRFAAVRTPTSAVLTTLLQYGLIGDPATRLNLPTRPDLLIPPAASPSRR
ncbi:hypothetical protein AWN76_009305 [Rhodothermaceae bacterium RA]|nr:hypothetical protein AWN76_009305 [Rhodothermaceae bacterium RA]